MDTTSSIRRVLASVCELDSPHIGAETTLLDLGVDSVRILELVAAIEETLSVQLSPLDPEVAKLRTVGQLVELIDRRRPR
jgi:acyl carrier protein